MGGAAPPPPVDIEPGDETATLAGVVDRLWEIEQPYRLVPGSDVVLSLQQRADYDPLRDDGSVIDRASDPLFSSVDRTKFSPLDLAFIALLDNYEREGGERESVSNAEKQEIDRFMDLLD